MRVKEQKKGSQVNGEEAKERQEKGRYSWAEAEKGGKDEKRKQRGGKLFLMGNKITPWRGLIFEGTFNVSYTSWKDVKNRRG